MANIGDDDAKKSQIRLPLKTWETMQLARAYSLGVDFHVPFILARTSSTRPDKWKVPLVSAYWRCPLLLHVAEGSTTRNIPQKLHVKYFTLNCGAHTSHPAWISGFLHSMQD